MTVTTLPATRPAPLLLPIFDPSTTYAAWMLAHSQAEQTRSTRLGFKGEREREWGEAWDRPAEFYAGWLEGYAGWTQRTYFSHLDSIFRWRVDTQQTDFNPMTRMRRRPAPRKKARPLSEFERRRALEAAQGDDLTFLLLGILQGLRAQDIASMHGRNVTEGGLYVVGKGGQGDMLPTHPLIWQLAQTYPRDAYWFPSDKTHRGHIISTTVTRRVSALFRTLGVEGSSHRSRHTFGTQLRKNGADIKVVQMLMRHRSLATTDHYLGFDDDELRDALYGLSA